MTEIITVRFKRGGKLYFFDPKGLQIKETDGVIVETARGSEFAECMKGNHTVSDDKIHPPLRGVVRVANEKDIAMIEKNQQKEKHARKVCLEKIKQHKLDMKIVGVEYSFEGNKVLFFFTSDGRVDFRGLVKDLAATIHARIELRQIGVRDESKMVGGLGICGRPFCCNVFLDKFAPVSIKMAKTQNLSLNPAKISGTCGRLMCCLKYEQDAYEHLLKTTPRSDSFVQTPDGAGTISAVNLLRQQVSVRLESDPSVAKKYHNTEIIVVRSGKGRRPEGYVEPPLHKLEKQRRVVEENITTRPTGVNQLASDLDAIFNPTKAPTTPPNNKRNNRRRNQSSGGNQEQQAKNNKRNPSQKSEKQQGKPKDNQNKQGNGQNQGKDTPNKPKNNKPNPNKQGKKAPQEKQGTENHGKQNAKQNTTAKEKPVRPPVPKKKPNSPVENVANKPKPVEKKSDDSTTS